MIVSRDSLLHRIAQAEPRIVLLAAPAGYGKTTVANALAASYGRSAVCDCDGVADAADFARRFLSAAAVEFPEKALPLARRRLALDGGDGEILQLAADVAAEQLPERSLFVLENAESLAGSAEALALFKRILARSASARTIAVCSRVDLLRGSSRIAPHELLRVGIDDLRFDPAEVDVALDDANLTDNQRAAVSAACGGWPIAVLLLRRVAREGRLSDVLPYVAGDALEPLQEYLDSQVLSRIDPRALDALLACAVIPDATDADVEAALGSSDALALLKETAEIGPFLAHRKAASYDVHPLLWSLLSERHAERCAQLQVTAARTFSERGDCVRAAEIYLSAGMPDDAARELERPMETIVATSVPPPRYLPALFKLDADAVLAHPGLWTMLNAQRVYPVNPERWLERVEPVWRDLPADASDMVLLNVFSSVAISYAYQGKFAKTEVLLEEYVARVHTPGIVDRITTMLWRTFLDALSGRCEVVDALRGEAEPLMAYHPISDCAFQHEVVARIHRLRGERDLERIALERARDDAVRSELPELQGLILCDMAFAAFLADDGARFDAAIAQIRALSDAAMITSTAHFLACAEGRGRYAAPGFGIPALLASAHIIGFARAAETSEARENALAAFAAAERSNRPFLRILTRIALAFAQPERKRELLREADALARATDTAPLVKAVADVRRGGGESGMFAGIVAAARRAGGARDPSFALLGAMVEGAAGRVRLTHREYQLLALLALGAKSQTAAEITAMLWPDADESAGRNALKVLIRRVRMRVGAEAIVSSADGYRLSPGASVDLFDVEALLRACGASAVLSSERRERLNDARAALAQRSTAQLADDEWFAPTERRIREVEHEVERALARDALAAGDAQTLLGVARAMTQTDLYDEDAREFAIRGFLLLGDATGALREYRDYRELLRRELDSEPSERLRALVLNQGPVPAVNARPA